MIYHVLPGDSVAEEFKKTNIDGQTIVCREALVAGPLDGENLDEFWDQRAKFILTEYGEDEIEYHEKVADPLNLLTELTRDDEVNLWFEYELFCSVHLWFCLSLLKDTGAAAFRVEPIGLDAVDRWDGFGKFTADDLKACFVLRTKLTEDDITVGASLWEAYRRKDHAALSNLAKTDSLGFPYLNEVTRAAVDENIEPIEVLRAIRGGGETEFSRIFVEFKKRAGVYGYGDLQVERLMDKI